MGLEQLQANERRAKKLLDRTWTMLIGGKMVEAVDGSVYDTMNPATGETLARVPLAQKEDVDRAVAAALEAFDGWRRKSVPERAGYVREFIAVLKEHAEDLALMDSINSGNPIRNMIRDVDLAVEHLQYQCGAAMELKGSVIPATAGNWHLTRREPYGVVGRIIAFNHPILFAASKLGAPILAGNTLVLKVPDQTPLAPLWMANLIRDVFPPGVVNIISGTGPVTGDALVRHPRVKRLSLIGSVETGRRIQRAAAETGIKYVSLELGGKNPMIVYPDADLEKAVEGAVTGMNFTWQGQSCGSTSRLFLHRDIHDAFVERLKERVERIRLGNPLDPDTEMGCVVSEAQYEKVMRYIRLGREQGARCVAGGDAPEDAALAAGYFVRPTIFTNVTMDMSIAREEIFGPVLSVLCWEDEEEVIRQANSVPYGLTASVWTRDLNTALRAAEKLEAGFVWINGSSRHFAGVPFSGQKASGVDAEEGIEELYSYTQNKSVNILLD